MSKKQKKAIIAKNASRWHLILVVSFWVEAVFVFLGQVKPSALTRTLPLWGILIIAILFMFYLAWVADAKRELRG